MSFQENLRYYREKAGYKQAKEFAKILNISYTTYTSYENQGREPKYNTLCKIADILQVSTDDLLGRTTNIIGNNEDERLKKTIQELIYPCISIADISIDDITENNINVVITGGMGQRAIDLIKANGGQVILGASGEIKEVLKVYLQGSLYSKGSACAHHHHEEGHKCEH